MSEKKRNILLSVFLSLLIVTLMSFSLTQARYSKEPESGSDISGDIDFVVSQSIVIESVDDFFTAIENGYTNIQISDEVDNPLVITGGVADVNSDLTIDLNGHEIQRNNREPMLDIQEGVRLTITDSKGGGGFYNPVGSVLRISGGTLTVTNGLFESGPRNGVSMAETDGAAEHKSEYATSSGSVYSTPAGASASESKRVIYYEKSGASYTKSDEITVAPILVPNAKKSTVNTGRFVVNGNMYFENGAENGAEIGGFTVDADTYLYYTLEGDNIDNTTIATEGSADFYYEYYVTQDASTGAVTYAGTSAGENTLLVTVYGYQNAKEAANPTGSNAEIPDYAAIQMQSGNIYVRGGGYTSYFGEKNTYCVYATGGNMAVENGTFEAHGNGTCVSMAIVNAGGTAEGESEEALRIAHGAFYSQVGDTISVAAGTMRVTGGSFYKNATSGTGTAAGANNAIINISGGTLEVTGTADSRITFDLTGSYMYGIESAAESRVGEAATLADAGRVTVTNADFTFNGGSNAGVKTDYTTNYGIYAQTGTITAKGCVFCLPDINSRGISIENGTVNVGGADGGEPSSGLATNTYSYFYIDESLGGFGVYANTEQQDGSSDTSASSENVAVNISAAQIFVGQSKTADPTDTSYNFVNGAGVYMNAGGENSKITLGNVLIIASGNCTSGIYVANGTVTQASNAKLVVITGAAAQGYKAGEAEFRDIDSEKNYGVTVENGVRSITDLINEKRIVNQDVQYTYGVYGGGGTVTLGNVYAAVYGTNAAGILTENAGSNITVNGTLALRAEGPQGSDITVSGISTESGDIKLSKGADIEVGYGLGITARSGKVTFASGTADEENSVNITTKDATAVYINNGTLTIGSDGNGGDHITANIVSTIAKGTSWTTPPSGTQGNVTNQFDGVYVQGGSLMSYGTFNVTHKGVANDDQYNNNGATLYQTFVTKSFAVRVETSSAANTAVEIRQGTIQSVVEGTDDSQTGGGGGLYVGYPADSAAGSAAVTLGRELAENEPAPTLTIQSFGSDIIDKDIAYQDGSNWEYRQSRTGGPAVEVNGGSLDIYYGNYSAAMGDGIRVKNGTVNIYKGTFVGADSYAPPNGGGGIMAGAAASYGFKLYGGTVNIYDGTFGYPKATGLAAGSGAFVMGISASSKATANIYGGTFEVAGQAGFSVYQYVDVLFDEYGGEGGAGSKIYAKGFEAGMTVEYHVNSDNNTTITVKSGTFEGSGSSAFANGIWYGEGTSQLTIEDGEFIGRVTSGLYFVTAPGTNRSPSNVQLYGGTYQGVAQRGYGYDGPFRDDYEYYYNGAIGATCSRNWIGSWSGVGADITVNEILADGRTAVCSGGYISGNYDSGSTEMIGNSLAGANTITIS